MSTTSSRSPLLILSVGLLLALAAGACRAVLGLDEQPADPAADDGGVAQEASADAADDVETRSWCESQPQAFHFCADFDRGDLTASFPSKDGSGSLMSGGGTFAPDEKQLRSPPRSAAFALPALLTDAAHADARLTKEIGITGEVPRYLIISTDVRIDTVSMPAGKGRVTLLSIDFGRDIGEIGVYRDAVGLNLEVYDGLRSVKRVPFTEVLPIGQWGTLSLTIRNYATSGTDGEVTASLGGVSATLAVPAVFQDPAFLPLLNVGAHTSRGPMDVFRVSLDNVRVDLRDGP